MDLMTGRTAPYDLANDIELTYDAEESEDKVSEQELKTLTMPS